MKTEQCPCGSSKNYNDCCGIAHNNITHVETAEQLMRSRYTAFTLANDNYLHLSHHSETRPKSKADRNETVKWAKSITWLKLEVLKTSEGLSSDNFGIVEFKAYYLENGITQIIHEISTFEKENGHWVYVDGQI